MEALLLRAKRALQWAFFCWFGYVLAWDYFRAALKWAAGLPEADRDGWIYSATLNEIHGYFSLSFSRAASKQQSLLLNSRLQVRCHRQNCKGHEMAFVGTFRPGFSLLFCAIEWCFSLICLSKVVFKFLIHICSAPKIKSSTETSHSSCHRATRSDYIIVTILCSIPWCSICLV